MADIDRDRIPRARMHLVYGRMDAVIETGELPLVPEQPAAAR